MKVLTADQMRDVDRRTAELGIPSLILMENAGQRVVEYLAREFGSLADHRIAVVCGKGNNGGDGLVVARQLHTRFRPRSLEVVLEADAEELRGDAAANLQMLSACGCPLAEDLSAALRNATLVVDAVLGTGLEGVAGGRALEAILAINREAPRARVVAVDIPSGLPSDSPYPSGEFVLGVHATVTFTAPKVAHALPPNCDEMGQLVLVSIGSPAYLYAGDDDIYLSIVEPAQFRHLFAPRRRGGHKGDYGHVGIVGGSEGKTGAAAMAGMAALRAGAGLVTVACSEVNFTALMPELMSEPLPGNPANKDVIAIGPGLGTAEPAVAMVRQAFSTVEKPMVLDADGLNCLTFGHWPSNAGLRVLTPHPGEMARLVRKSVADVMADRTGVARDFAVSRGVCLVLKGQRTLIAWPDGRVWINPTGTPAMATAGSGDILTGLIAGLLAQFPHEADQAVAAAVYLHGLAGEIGVAQRGEKSLTATDLLAFLPEACARVSN